MKTEDYARRLAEHYRNRLAWSKEVAETSAAIAADVLCSEYGGERHYIPQRMGRRGIIYKEYNGRNAAELSRKYAISARTVARIVSEKKRK